MKGWRVKVNNHRFKKIKIYKNNTKRHLQRCFLGVMDNTQEKSLKTSFCIVFCHPSITGRDQDHSAKKTASGYVAYICCSRESPFCTGWSLSSWYRCRLRSSRRMRLPWAPSNADGDNRLQHNNPHTLLLDLLNGQHCRLVSLSSIVGRALDFKSTRHKSDS